MICLALFAGAVLTIGLSFNQAMGTNLDGWSAIGHKNTSGYSEAPPPIEKIQVEIYYEGQCDGCAYFFRQELLPTFAELGDYIKLRLIPYGFARIVSDGEKEEIECSKGSDECMLNRLNACAFEMLTDMHAKVGIAFCLFEDYLKPLKNLDKCSSYVGLSAKKILACAQGLKGFELELAYGRETLSERQNVTHEFWTPWIVINKNWRTWVYGHRNLRQHVCDILQGQGLTPDGCPQPDPSMEPDIE